MISVLLILILSYLVGSIPGSVWVGKLMYGQDVRQHGSGNAGATNTFRVLGWRAGLLATVVDLGKGLLAAGVIANLRVDALPHGLGFWEADSVVRLLAARELLMGTQTVAAAIKDGASADLRHAIESGREAGMAPLEDALVGYVRSGVVDVREACRKAPDRERLMAGLRAAAVDTTAIDRLS
jgi:hypothetical protein